MTAAFALGAAALALATAVGHSITGERRILQPLYSGEPAGVLRSRATRAILRAVFHVPSFAWATLGIGVLLGRLGGGDRLVASLAAVVFAGCAVANLAALRRPHPGGLMLLGAAALCGADLALA